MLFEIGFIILAIMCPVMVLVAYRQGVKDRQSLDTDKPLEPVIRLPKPQPKPSKEDAYYNTILSNVEAYDGTNKGQKDVII